MWCEVLLEAQNQNINTSSITKIIFNAAPLQTLLEESSRTSYPLLTRPLDEMQGHRNTTSSNSRKTTVKMAPRYSFNKSWHNTVDMTERKIILKEIARRIQKRIPNAPSIMKKNLRMMARKTEEALYKQAPSKEDYADLLTLENRLEDLARRVKEHSAAIKTK